MLGRVVCVLAMMLSIAFSPLRAQSFWQWQHPDPQGHNLYAIDVIAASAAVAVGGMGSVVKTTDAGASWTVLSTVPGQPNLNGVSHVGGTTIVAVGAGGTIVRTTDAGGTWSIRASGTTSDLLDVDFADALHGVAVGAAGTVLRSNDGGVTWNAQTSGSSTALHGVKLVDATIATAVGTGGVILKTTDGGANWSVQTSGTSASLLSVDYVDANTGMAVGAGLTVLGTTDGGANWSPLSPVPGYPHALLSVDMVDASNVFAVGGEGGEIFAIISTNDGGASWNLADGVSAQLLALTMFNSNDGVAVGLAGNIRRTSGGASWPQTGGGLPRYTMRALDFFGMRGVAVSTDSQGVGGPRVYVTADDGATWNVSAPFVGRKIRDVAFADATTVYAAGRGLWWLDRGASIWRSDDGGMTWVEIFDELCYPGVTSCVQQLHGVDFADVNTGVAVGRGLGGGIVEILGGAVTQVTSPTTETLNAVSVPTPTTACAVGDNGTIVRGTPGGLWNVVSSVGVSVRLNDVSFVDDWNGTAVGEMGTILRTDDGGFNWSQWSSGTTANLTSVSFLNATDGIIAAGTTLLKTRDGGATWVAEEMLTNVVDVVYRDPVTVSAVGGHENIIVRPDVPVPVFFQDFTAVASQNFVELRWAVHADEVIRGFQVYRGEGETHDVNITSGLMGAAERSFMDRDVVPGEVYGYTLVAIDEHGTRTRSQTATVEVPSVAITLQQNRPNPFNPSTHIRFTIDEATHVTLTIYDVAGRHVRMLVNRTVRQGSHTAAWDGRDANGDAVASGVYLYRLAAGKRTFTRKAVLLK